MGDGGVMPARRELERLEANFDFDIEVTGNGSHIQVQALTNGIVTSFPKEEARLEVNACGIASCKVRWRSETAQCREAVG